MKKITRKNLDPLIQRYATDKKVLDVGSAASPYTKYFPNRVGLDISPDNNPDIVADAHDLPFKEGDFSFVLCTEVLEHVKDPKKVVSEIYRILPKGGVCVLTTRFVYPLHAIGDDRWRFTPTALEELFADFAEVTIAPETQTFSAVAALLQRIIFQTNLRCNKLTKAFLFLLVWLFDHMNWLIKDEYANIEKTKPHSNIMSTGYLVYARK
jgi:SAM-dependent methyltransferase